MFSGKIISKILAGGLRLWSGKCKKCQGLKCEVLQKQRLGIKEDLLKESERGSKDNGVSKSSRQHFMTLSGQPSQPSRGLGNSGKMRSNAVPVC